MKSSYIICAALAIALCIVTWHLVAGNSSDKTAAAADSTATATTDAYNCIMTRASCRTFTDQRPSEGQIDSMLRAAMAAPTAKNQQAWQFVVITDRDILDSIAANCRNIKMAAEAPLAIAVCGDLTIARDKEHGSEKFLQQDLSAATENLLLAAHAMGLGAVWCGIYPDEERTRLISRYLELPETIIPLNIIPIGYPAAPLTPKDKFSQSRIHYNTY